MAPKKSDSTKKKRSHSPDPDGIFHGMVVFLVSKGIQPRRLQSLLRYQWLENCLKSGERLSEDQYIIKPESYEEYKSADAKCSGDGLPGPKRNRVSSEGSQAARTEGGTDDGKMSKTGDSARPEDQSTYSKELNENASLSHSPSSELSGAAQSEASEEVDTSQLSSLYNPPNLNRNITEIFDKLTNIYGALGDDRRSFSYYKAISVIEKLPFKIEDVHQVKDLPAIGKSMKDHIHEIVNSGRLSKLEHFEQDEKVRCVTLLGEVWGIGPATALKLYEKGHRTLEDLENEDSLTTSQRIGLKYFDDIKKRIPRSEVKDMEMLLQKAGEDILPGP